VSFQNDRITTKTPSHIENLVLYGDKQFQRINYDREELAEVNTKFSIP
jgi:hypothetical protein